jgi:hypothetical protein
MNDPGRKLAPPTITVENVNLEQFEALVYSRQHEEAGRELLRDLKRLKVGGEFAGHPMNDETRPRLYTRLAAAIGALFADPSFQLSQEGFDLLAVEHATFHAVFQASAFGNADHLLRQFATLDANNPGQLHFTTPQHIVKLLLAYSLDSELDIDFEAVFRAAPRLALPAFLGMLAHIVVFSPRAHARRERLLQLGPLFEQVDLHEYMLPAMSDAYMYTSYATADTKHHIKRSFNGMMRGLISKQIAIAPLPTRGKAAKRPTLLVPIEWFTSLHAMYRCFAPSVERLGERFRLVMMGRESEMDAVSKQIFDDVIELKGANVSLSDVIGEILRLKPDMIFYPSVGMATWWVATSTLRLAPIQISGMGHPASTMSEAIDYMVVEDRYPGDPSAYSEIAVMRRGELPMVLRADAEPPQPEVRPSPEVLRIAVPAMACKINAPFLAIAQSISRQCRRPVEFHFFPNMVGLTWFHAAKQIRSWLPNAVVYPRSDYNTYLQNLRNCDVHLSPFPFGGCNSNLDSFLLGIPIVALEGIEYHSQQDPGMMRAAGLPEWLISYHPAEYERVALRLIHDDAERVAIAQSLRRTDVSSIFFSRPSDERVDDYLELFDWMYRHHEAIVASGRRYWTVEERKAFP